mmetsp:Transcript_14190/g.15714  ORF Transcript_14190/g.15714 Transcript_14190/m.15714 type:complete len:104 (-) Transcript_14190:271-582(-)
MAQGWHNPPFGEYCPKSHRTQVSFFDKVSDPGKQVGFFGSTTKSSVLFRGHSNILYIGVVPRGGANIVEFFLTAVLFIKVHPEILIELLVPCSKKDEPSNIVE